MNCPGFFDLDSVTRKLESYMRTQESEMCQMTNTKKRKFDERWSDMDKEELELEEDYRDDLCFQFNKRQRLDDSDESYYPLSDDELDEEEVSPLALPSPISIADSDRHSAPWPFLDTTTSSPPDHSLAMSLAMRRQLSGYSEVTTIADDHDSADDSWMSTAPTQVDLSPGLTLSRTSISSSVSTPRTPRTSIDTTNTLTLTGSSETLMSPVPIPDPVDGTIYDLDLDSMAPYERVLLSKLAPEYFEKAIRIKKAFRRSGKLLDKCADEDAATKLELRLEAAAREVELGIGEKEFDEVFADLVHV